MDSSALRWSIPISLASAWGIKVALDGSPDVLLQSVIGTAALLLVVMLVIRNRGTTRIFWDAERSLLAIVRTWTIEVSAGRMIESIPTEIDLSHNSRRVLVAMGARYEDEEGGELTFSVLRPLESAPTLMGFVVSRKKMRIVRDYVDMQCLADMVTSDSQVLESAMRASFYHTPISVATAETLVRMKSGGVALAR